METFEIPAHTFRARRAPYPVGPWDVPAGVSSFALSVDCSQAVGDGRSVDVAIERSIDDGTWERFSGFGFDGGRADSEPVTVECTFWHGEGERYVFPDMQVQVVVTVHGASFVVSGGELVVD